MQKKDTVRTYKDIWKNPHAVASCQIYKECETSITYDPYSAVIFFEDEEHKWHAFTSLYVYMYH